MSLCSTCGLVDAPRADAPAACPACGRHVTRVPVVRAEERALTERMVLGRAPGSRGLSADERAREKWRALTEWRDRALGGDPRRP